MTPVDGLVSMAGGNPGAITAMMELLGGKGATEQQQADGYIDILLLDDMGIYESDLWICYKDIYGFDIDKFREAIKTKQVRVDLDSYHKGNK